MFGSAQGGDDTLTGTFQSGAFSGSFSVLLGDAAEMMESTQGGDDTLTGTFDAYSSGTLWGTPGACMIPVQGGSDTLTITAAHCCIQALNG